MYLSVCDSNTCPTGNGPRIVGNSKRDAARTNGMIMTETLFSGDARIFSMIQIEALLDGYRILDT
jgi:hypothetical protein